MNARAIADVWAAIVERKRRTGEPSNILKRRKKRRRQNTAEKRTEQKRPQQEDSNRTEKGKSFQYVCPHCDQSVTSTTRTGQVDLRGTCGHRFRVREGRLCAKAYDYVCPACNGHVASNVATGHIDHRRVCLWEQFFCEGWCCERERFGLPVPILQRKCEKRCEDRANQPSARVRQPVLCHGRCSQQENTVSCAQLPGVLNCCLVIAVMWAHCGHA